MKQNDLSRVIENGIYCLLDVSTDAIPNNMEKYLHFSIGKLKFLDSLQFMNSSLSTLVENLAKGGITEFKNTKKFWVNKARLKC